MNLIPPDPDYPYFQRAGRFPFEATATGFSLTNAAWLADASLLAYGDQELVDRGLAGTPLSGEIVGVGTGTECLVAHDAKAVIVAFRGTELRGDLGRFSDVALAVLRDIMTNTLVTQRPEQGSARVHTGFQQALDRIWEAPLLDRLERLGVGAAGAGAQRSLWLTGHSLGAALATIAAVRLGESATGLYTFGSPRVGNRHLEQHLHTPAFRVVNRQDFVPQLPPEARWWLVPWYRHVGVAKYLGQANDDLSTPPDPLEVHRETLELRLLPVSDHAPRHYCEQLWRLVEAAAQRPTG